MLNGKLEIIENFSFLKKLISSNSKASMKFDILFYTWAVKFS